MTGWDFILLGFTIFVSVLAALVVYTRLLGEAMLAIMKKGK